MGFSLRMKHKYKHCYLDIAYRFSQLSHCERLKVGCVIVKDDFIISHGYNGTPTGFDNCCEENSTTKDIVIHAERNALIRLARSHESSVGASMFLTHSCCKICASLIISAGIKEVYYKTTYRDTEGIRLLRQAGIYVEQLEL